MDIGVLSHQRWTGAKRSVVCGSTICILLISIQNYVVTTYAAEIINTLTNLMFMYLASKGIRNCLKHGHDTIFLIAFIGYVLVGIGSFFFHATLKCKCEMTVLVSALSDATQILCSSWTSSR